MMGDDGEGANVLLGGGPASVDPTSSATRSAKPSAPHGAQAPAPHTQFAANVASGPEHTYQVAQASHVADAVHDATDSGIALRITAGCGWLDAGHPIAAPTRRLDLSALRGIVEYNPGDLTLTAGAATTLAEIDEATRAHGQWLPLDPLGAGTDTIGATLATASCGPLASYMGLPRDLALGIEFVDGRGTILRAGGKVVKNVAGFDLVRLTVGAWGTLGVITEVTVRLRARPERAITVALDVPESPGSLATLLSTLRTIPLTPIAAELLSAPLAALIGAGAGDGDVVLLRLAGNAASLAAQRAELALLGIDRDAPEMAWDQLRRSLPSPVASFRASHRPSRLAELWTELGTAARMLPGTLSHASLERGVARCMVPSANEDSLAVVVGDLSRRWSVVGEQLPPAAWTALPIVGGDRLSVGVRAAFDPHALLNPGILTSSA